MNELKSCPFCGSVDASGVTCPPKLIDVPNESDGLHMAVQCTVEGCWATIEEWTLDDPATAVVARWNRRVSPPSRFVLAIRKLFS
jgi:hypothetical protein